MQPAGAPESEAAGMSVARGRYAGLRELAREREARRALGFVLAGGLSALVTLSLTSWLVEGEKQPFLISAVLGTEMGILVNFTVNDRLAFADLAGRQRHIAVRLLRFHITSAFGQGLFLLLSLVLHNLAHWPTLASQAVPAALVMGVSFTLHRYWTYRGTGTGRGLAEVATVSSVAVRTRPRIALDRLLDRLRALKVRLTPHRVPLVLVGLSAVVGQVVTLAQHPLVAPYSDTRGYLLSAQQIATSLGFVQTFRAPGFPSFLAAVFALTGGIDYERAATCTAIVSPTYCQQALRPVVAAQAALALLVTLGMYVLIYRITRRRVTACVVAALLAFNLFVLSWERAILSEFLSYASLVAVFLCFERFVRGPRPRTAVVLGLVFFAAIMVRPFNIYLPPLLLGLCALRLLWTRRWRQQWRPLLLTGAVVASMLLGYMSVNAVANDFFGLTWEQNVTLLGKLMEYKMVGLATDPQYQPIQADAVTFVNSGGIDPTLFGHLHPAYSANGYQAAGAFARSVILRHPLTYLIHTVSDVRRTWQISPTFYAPTNTTDRAIATTLVATRPAITTRRDGPAWLTMGLYNLSRAEEKSFLLLPWLLALIVGWLWRRPRDSEAFLLIALLLAVVSGIALASAGNYAEYYRVRSPIDWAMIAVTLVVGLEALSFMLKRAPVMRLLGGAGGEGKMRAVEMGGSDQVAGQVTGPITGVVKEPPLKLLDRVIQWWRIAKVRPYIRNGSRVLDIGCADGALFRQLGDRLSGGVGVDPALERTVTTSDGRFRLIAGRLSRQQLMAEDAFDVVTMLAVAEHLPEEVIPGLRDDCAALLKPGGLLLITVPSVRVDQILSWLTRLHLIAGMSLHEHHGFDPASVPRLFGGAGLTLVRARQFQMGLNNLFVFQKTGGAG